MPPRATKNFIFVTLQPCQNKICTVCKTKMVAGLPYLICMDYNKEQASPSFCCCIICMETIMEQGQALKEQLSEENLSKYETNRIVTNL